MSGRMKHCRTFDRGFLKANESSKAANEKLVILFPAFSNAIHGWLFHERELVSDPTCAFQLSVNLMELPRSSQSVMAGHGLGGESGIASDFRQSF